MAGRVVRLLAVVAVVMLGGALAAALPGAQSAVAAPAARGYQLGAGALPRDDASPLASIRTPRANFPFQTTTSADGKIVVHFYSESGDFGGKVIALAQSRLQAPIQTTLGFALLRPVNIYAFASRADFLAGSPVTDAEETAALAEPATNSIYLVMLDTKDDTTIDILTHELTHIVFHQNEDSDSFQEKFFGFYPNWLDEGLAASDEVLGTPRYDLLLDQAVSAQTKFDILHDFVWDYPKDVDTNLLAYAESQSFIAYLRATYGAQAFHTFLTGAHDGDLTLAAETAFDAYLPTLEARWQVATGLPTTAQLVGYVPFLPAVQPYHPTAPSAAALRRTPTRAEWPTQATGWIAFVAVLIALAFCVLAGEWQRQRRRDRWVAGPPGGVPISLQIGGGYPVQPWNAPAPQAEPSVTATTAPDLPPPPPVYEDADALHAAAPSGPAVTTITATSAPKPARISLQQRSRPRWFDAPALVVPLVCAVAAGVARVLLDPAHEWRNGYLAAGGVGAVCAVALALLTLRALPSSGLPAHRVMALLAVALLVGGAIVGATPAAHAQAARYEDDGAYTLALRLYADAGEGHARMVADLSRTHLEWASVALSQQDYATATTQLRAAIALDTAHATTARGALTHDTALWAEALYGNGRFGDAIAAVTGEAGDASCDGACHAALHQELAKVYLAQGDAASIQGDATTATQAYQTVLNQFGDTQYAGTAKTALPEIAAHGALTAALAAGARGDDTTMNAKLNALVAAYPGTAAADVAGRTPQRTSGFIQDASGAATQGDAAYFLAFATAGDARAYGYDFRTDTTLFKITTTLGPGGAFAVRLPPGYWYVLCWDDPSQIASNHFNVSQSADNGAFTVSSLQPASIGVILGY